MADKIIENNQVSMMGKIAAGFTFSHQVFGEGFYMVDVRCKRLSESYDIIPVMVSERLLDVWIETNRISYTELPVVNMENQHWLKKGSRFLMRKLRGTREK